MPEGIEYDLNGEPHRLLQFHFHAPSEHSLGGRHAAMEAHLVHRNLATGAFTVVAVLMEPGSTWLPNPCLAIALLSAPAVVGVAAPLCAPISLRSLLPRPRGSDGRRPYASYG